MSSVMHLAHSEENRMTFFLLLILASGDTFVLDTRLSREDCMIAALEATEQDRNDGRQLSEYRCLVE